MTERETENETEHEIDQRHFRDVLGHFPTGVTVVTSSGQEGPVGITIGSFTSVSLDPPLVAWLPTRDSGTWAQIREQGHFCVNVLAHDQDWLSNKMAGTGDDKFAEVEFEEGPTGAPRLKGAVAWLDCEIEAVHEAGDHDIVVGRVKHLEVADSEAPPLIFHRGKYRTVS